MASKESSPDSFLLFRLLALALEVYDLVTVARFERL